MFHTLSVSSLISEECLPALPRLVEGYSLEEQSCSFLAVADKFLKIELVKKMLARRQAAVMVVAQKLAAVRSAGWMMRERIVMEVLEQVEQVVVVQEVLARPGV